MKATALSPADWSPLVELLDDELSDDLDGVPRHLWERALGVPAREFLRRPGKQFRARLVETAWVIAGGTPGAIPPALPLIVELLHAGSLIVDDIEDGSDWRRGGPSLHRVVGLPLALNTGNWMYFWPLELIDRLPFDQHRRAMLLREARTAVERCHRGQALDISLRVTELDQADIPRVVRTTTRLKTGALMELAAAVGAIAAGAAADKVDALRRFARSLGAGLQMLDDLSGIVSPDRMHKGEEDLANARPTWPWAWVATAASPAAFANLLELAAKVAAGDTPATSLARQLRAIVAKPGAERVHSSLHLSLADLESEFGSGTAIDMLRAEIARLEKSYV